MKTANGTQNPSLYLFQSDPSDLETCYQNRNDAVADANTKGPGRTETIKYTAHRTDWHGFVIVNASGSGVYTIRKRG